MFLPLLNASERNNGKGMIGDLVQVYTADGHVYLYEIFQVKRHSRTSRWPTTCPWRAAPHPPDQRGAQGHHPQTADRGQPGEHRHGPLDEANPKPSRATAALTDGPQSQPIRQTEHRRASGGR
jgi:hypothetical protein